MTILVMAVFVAAGLYLLYKAFMLIAKLIVVLVLLAALVFVGYTLATHADWQVPEIQEAIP